MNTFKFLLFLITIAFLSNSINAQITLNGLVKDNHGNALESALISLDNSKYSAISNSSGNFTIENVDMGEYKIVITHLGYKTFKSTILVQKENKPVTFILEEDIFNLKTVVVTGTFEPRIQLQSTTSVSTLNSEKLDQIAPRGTANILSNIPGTFTDASAGEVFTKIYTRGVSAAAEDDLGWYYVSLQEDGLPVSLVQHSYYSPDLFYRYDINTEKVEAIRGGSSSITAMNAPGGIYNFISKGIRNQLGGQIQLQSGVQGDGNPIYRADVSVGGPLGNNWFLNFGGYYRYDNGSRNTDFAFGKGGQVKFNLIKKNDHGYFKLYGKLLNDKTNRYTGVAATNWKDPKPAFGQDFGTTALMMPEFDANIPDGRFLASNKSNGFDPSQGVHAKDIAFGLDIFQNIGNGWSIKNNMKFSSKKANWQTSISNAFVSLNNPLAYFISGADFPIGQIVFYDAKSNSEVARIDNSGILAGAPIQYLTSGTLPNDAIMGTSAWYKDNDANEFMQQLTLRKEWENHDLNFGFSTGISNTSLFTQGSFAYVTYEPNPKMLRVTLENPNEPIIALSDPNGVSNYGGLFFINARAKVSQFAGFMNDHIKLSENLHLDLGLRLEKINHDGSKDRFAPFSQNGGLDKDSNTAYDNGILATTGAKDFFNYNYDYLSYSTGLNYKIANNTALFARYSRGNKAPELNHYFNNFSNVPINGKGQVQKINQTELGIKSNLKNVSFAGTLFWSELSNIGVTNFEFDSDSNTIFYTPIQLNTSETFGLEWESMYTPFEHITVSFNGTLQNPKAKSWNIYDAAGSVNVADDSIQDFSGNKLPFNPEIMFNLGIAFEKDKLSSFLKWQFMGQREGNVANAFQLPAYSLFDLGIGYEINTHLKANLLVTNLFNSEGLANFFGANNFGSNANGATAEFIQNNPDASFVVVPVLPRGTLIKLNYTL